MVWMSEIKAGFSKISLIQFFQKTKPVLAYYSLSVLNYKACIFLIHGIQWHILIINLFHIILLITVKIISHKNILKYESTDITHVILILL